MIDTLQKHLTYANVTATLALFVALGGSAWAVGARPSGNANPQHLGSPSGSDTVAATNSGVRLASTRDGHTTSLTLSNGDLVLDSPGGSVKIEAGGSVEVRAGADVETTASEDIADRATNISAQAAGTVSLSGADELLEAQQTTRISSLGSAEFGAPLTILGAPNTCITPMPIARLNDPVSVDAPAGGGTATGTIVGASSSVTSC